MITSVWYAFEAYDVPFDPANATTFMMCGVPLDATAVFAAVWSLVFDDALATFVYGVLLNDAVAFLSFVFVAFDDAVLGDATATAVVSYSNSSSLSTARTDWFSSAVVMESDNNSNLLMRRCFYLSFVVLRYYHCWCCIVLYFTMRNNYNNPVSKVVAAVAVIVVAVPRDGRVRCLRPWRCWKVTWPWPTSCCMNSVRNNWSIALRRQVWWDYRRTRVWFYQ